LAGALNQFIVDEYLRSTPPIQVVPAAKTEAASLAITDDDLPF
jgi:hypothetical protein